MAKSEGAVGIRGVARTEEAVCIRGLQLESSHRGEERRR